MHEGLPRAGRSMRMGRCQIEWSVGRCVRFISGWLSSPLVALAAANITQQPTGCEGEYRVRRHAEVHKLCIGRRRNCIAHQGRMTEYQSSGGGSRFRGMMDGEQWHPPLAASTSPPLLARGGERTAGAGGRHTRLTASSVRILAEFNPHLVSSNGPYRR